MKRPHWRCIDDEQEEFNYGFLPLSGDQRGYSIQITVFPHTHKESECFVSPVPLSVRLFMPHADESHGDYPLQESMQYPWLQSARAETESLGIIENMGDISYGAIAERRSFQDRRIRITFHIHRC